MKSFAVFLLLTFSVISVALVVDASSADAEVSSPAIVDSLPDIESSLLDFDTPSLDVNSPALGVQASSNDIEGASNRRSPIRRGPRRSVMQCRPNFHQAKVLTAQVVKRNKRLAAAFIRATFHDCVTFTRNRRGSGCNGSLRLRKELAFSQNSGLNVLFNQLELIVRKSCISMADAITIGVEVSLKLTGGPSVSLGRNRKDAVLPDSLSGQLPGISDFQTVKRFYGRKGLNVRDLVVSHVGGHALGRFFNKKFTPNENHFDNGYAINLLHFFKTRRLLPGFNVLRSDRALVEHHEGLKWIRIYANRHSGNKALNRDFNAFLLKIQKMIVH